MHPFKSMMLAAALATAAAAVPVQAQFVPDRTAAEAARAQVVPVSRALENGRHDQRVVFEGRILERVKHQKYVFADDSGRIIAKVPDSVFRDRRVTPETKIHLEGRLVLKRAKQDTIDVFSLTVLPGGQ